MLAKDINCIFNKLLKKIMQSVPYFAIRDIPSLIPNDGLLCKHIPGLNTHHE